MFSFMNAHNVREAPSSPSITATTVSGINTPATTDSEATLDAPPPTNTGRASEVDQLARLHAKISHRYMADSAHSALTKVNRVSAEMDEIKARLNALEAAIGPLIDLAKKYEDLDSFIIGRTLDIKSDFMVSRARVVLTILGSLLISAIAGAIKGSNAYSLSLTLMVVGLALLLVEEKAKPAAKK